MHIESPRPSLRPGTPHDVAACVDLWVESCAARDGVRVAGVAERARAKFDRECVWVVAVDPNESLTGFALATPPGSGTASDPLGAAVIGLLAVAPNTQRSGLGSRLLAAVTDRLTQDGYTEAVLHALTDNAPATRLYAAHGWKALGLPFEHTLLKRDCQAYVRDLSPL